MLDSQEVKEGKLQQLVVNMDTLAQERTAFADADVVFCTLGTTRAKAGSAAQFIKVHSARTTGILSAVGMYHTSGYQHHTGRL